MSKLIFLVLLLPQGEKDCFSVWQASINISSDAMKRTAPGSISDLGRGRWLGRGLSSFWSPLYSGTPAQWKARLGTYPATNPRPAPESHHSLPPSLSSLPKGCLAHPLSDGGPGGAKVVPEFIG